ncbi:hypothetical protein BLNAU_18360 [Blattamonas nauphoetae]|uniref:Transposase n=1 Tax=Blattamonas nauphoetae TaxID=2049346 RepID=A0ABQ9X4J1_9EUKA|nr:hypothetical protein BLNAU_18360 [Blattamonas nauphoetae]
MAIRPVTASTIPIHSQVHHVEGGWDKAVPWLPAPSGLTHCSPGEGAGLIHRVKRSAPLPTAAHRHARQQFAEVHADWTGDDWRKVMFSDESSVERCQNHGQQWLNGMLDSARYLNVVRRHVQQDGIRLSGEHFIFQQDNHCAHTADEALDYIERKWIQTVN